MGDGITTGVRTGVGAGTEVIIGDEVGDSGEGGGVSVGGEKHD